MFQTPTEIYRMRANWLKLVTQLAASNRSVNSYASPNFVFEIICKISVEMFGNVWLPKNDNGHSGLI